MQYIDLFSHSFLATLLGNEMEINVLHALLPYTEYPIHMKFILFLLILGCSGSLFGHQDSTSFFYELKANEFRKNTEPDSAVLYFKKAAKVFQNQGNIEKFVEMYNNIGIIQTRQDKYDEAKWNLNQALSAGLNELDSNDLTLSTTYLSLGVVHNAEGNYDQALTNHYKALEIRLEKLGEHSADVATCYGNIGNVSRNKGKLDDSIIAHGKALQIRLELFGENSAEIIESYAGLGQAHREKKEYDLAIVYFEKALRNKQMHKGKGHKDLVKFYKYLADVYYLMDNKTKGDEYKEQYQTIENKFK